MAKSMSSNAALTTASIIVAFFSYIARPGKRDVMLVSMWVIRPLMIFL